MGGLKSEAGASPALSRNCDPLHVESQVDRLQHRFHEPRGKEVERQIRSAYSLALSLSKRQGFLFLPNHMNLES